MLYNDIVGKNNISKCQRTEEFTRTVRALLYYVHANMYNRINCNCPRVIRRFSASLNVRVYDSDHPVTYVRKFCMNKLGHKIYRCMSVRSTKNNTLLHNPTIIHTKTFLRQHVICTRDNSACQDTQQDIIRFYIILRLYIQRHFLR